MKTCDELINIRDANRAVRNMDTVFSVESVHWVLQRVASRVSAMTGKTVILSFDAEHDPETNPLREQATLTVEVDDRGFQ